MSLIMKVMEKKTPLIKIKHKKRGITLIEVMAAIAIISILFVSISQFILSVAKNEAISERKLENYGYLKNILSIFENKLVKCEDNLDLYISFDNVAEMQEKILNLQEDINENKEYKLNVKINLIDEVNNIYRVFAKVTNSRNEGEEKYLYVYNNWLKED